MQSDIPEIKQGLQDRIADLCRQLLPRGKREGAQWVSHNPRVAGDEKSLPALKVGLVRDKGAWRCWRNGDKGDVIDLIAFSVGCDKRGALQWARDYLGLRSMSREERDALRRALVQRQKADAEKAVKSRLFKLKKAGELFCAADLMGAGSAAEIHARAYFAARCCPLEAVEHLNPLTYRFSAASEWWKGADWQNDNGRRFRTKEGPKFPAIHTAMRSATGIVTCCHVTFLDPIRPAKAPVTPAKLMFGEALGSVIEISMGPSGLPFWKATAEHAGPVIICEGNETGVSIAGPISEARVWAAGSLAGIGAVPVHLPCVCDITVARDNNSGNAQARGLLLKALDQLSDAGKPLDVMASHVGDDFNDLMTGED